jgi:hypothetical protein
MQNAIAASLWPMSQPRSANAKRKGIFQDEEAPTSDDDINANKRKPKTAPKTPVSAANQHKKRKQTNAEMSDADDFEEVEQPKTVPKAPVRPKIPGKQNRCCALKALSKCTSDDESKIELERCKSFECTKQICTKHLSLLEDCCSEECRKNAAKEAKHEVTHTT